MAAAAADSINQSSSSTSHTRKQGKLRSSALEDSGNFSLGTQEIFRDNLLSGFHKPTKMHFKNFIIFITNCMRHPLSTCNGKKKKKKKPNLLLILMLSLVLIFFCFSNHQTKSGSRA
jgi:hypothetical protein